MKLDYREIGVRIKDERTRQGITQERLAELAGLSVAHTSHIETGNTKVSLGTLVKIANSLKVSVDRLLCDSVLYTKPVFQDEICRHTQDCDENEIRIIADTVKALKSSLRKRNAE